ncbi:MAG: TRAP transporter small permease [Gammaproteobacteria bacterium]|nr:TRAP transporter small permease [Gammaproteobacteria bacterium]
MQAWALFGGALLVAVVLVNAISILSGIIFNKPFPGDFELTELGVGIAAFCFLPYCQLSGANVSADIFTSRLSPRSQHLLELIGHIVVVLFALLLLWRMSAGLLDYVEYSEITGVLSIPLWIAFPPALVSLFLLTVAAVVSVRETWNKI